MPLPAGGILGGSYRTEIGDGGAPRPSIYGDVTTKTAQQADRGHPSGIYEFTVSPNPQSVETHLGGTPAGTGAIWRYKKR